VKAWAAKGWCHAAVVAQRTARGVGHPPAQTLASQRVGDVTKVGTERARPLPGRSGLHSGSFLGQQPPFAPPPARRQAFLGPVWVLKCSGQLWVAQADRHSSPARPGIRSGGFTKCQALGPVAPTSVLFVPTCQWLHSLGTEVLRECPGDHLQGRQALVGTSAPTYSDLIRQSGHSKDFAGSCAREALPQTSRRIRRQARSPPLRPCYDWGGIHELFTL
jgi:hypothetical protein